MDTLVIASVADGSGQARLEVDYDETSDPTDWSLVTVRVVNAMDRVCYVLFQRGNGTNWLEGEVAANETVSQAAGGPVQTMSDLPRIMLVTR